VSDEGEALGTVTDVLQTGANDVYVITTPDKKEILVPAIHDCILQVDLEKQEMQIHLLPGLRD
jgi:16S rRNA processing protein RimM